MRRVYYVIYHESNSFTTDWLFLSLASLRKFTDADIVIVSDNLSNEKKLNLLTRFGATVRGITSVRWDKRRMLCKLELLIKILEYYSGEEGVELIMADVDVVFRGNPFGAFDDYQGFDLGFTTRFYSYPSPVNGGMVFYRNSPNLRKFITQMCQQIISPSWPAYKEVKNADNVDWNCDQDMLNAIYRQPVFFQDAFHIIVKDVGYRYNYCPGSDVFGTSAASTLLKWAYIERVYPVIHFKGNTKDLLYEPGFGELLRNQ